MLALGARAVLIGRPFSVAAIGGLQSGVETYLDALTTELKQAMVMTGTASCRAVSSDILA
jgi:isopentenyl diphosphate isomerase/L-lactate dehydrogenase-like FMN-dependent dehydrogenase